MKYMNIFALATLLCAATVSTLRADEQTVPPIPPTPAPVNKILYARAFSLDEAYKFEWRKEQPVLKHGTILVLEVDPALVYPRQIAEPVLYVGDQTAERVNFGHKSGRVVAVVPGKVDLESTLIWFGTPELPERVDARTVKAERKLAEKAEIKPLAAEQIETARTKGGEELKTKNREELHRNLADLIQEYSPEETELIERFKLKRD